MIPDNPWHHLPKKPPYVVSQDEPHIRAFNEGLAAEHKFYTRS
jgi:hypothetical protein